jgi:hypothetical protein
MSLKDSIPVSQLIKKSLSVKLEKTEIHRLIRLGYYTRPISKSTQKELDLKDSDLTEKRLLRRIRKHPALNQEKSVASNQTSTTTRAKVRPSTKPDVKVTTPHGKETTTTSPKKPVAKKPAPKKDPKQSKPVKVSPNQQVLDSIKTSVPPLLPCDDCLLPFSKLTSTTLPHVTFICGLPQIDRSIFSKVLSSRLSQIKTHLKKNGLHRDRLPSKVVSDQVHLLQRSIVLELKSLKDKKPSPTLKKKKAPKSKTTPAPSKETEPRTIMFEPEIIRDQKPTLFPIVADSPDDSEKVRDAFKLRTKLTHFLASYKLNKATGQHVSELLSIEQKYSYLDHQFLVKTTPPPGFSRPGLGIYSIQPDGRSIATEPNWTFTLDAPVNSANLPHFMCDFFSATLELLNITNSFGFSDAMTSTVKI